MIFPQPIRLAALALLLLLSAGSPAQVANPLQSDSEPESPVEPELEALEQTWWDYFEGERAIIEPRVEGFLAKVETQIGNLAPQNQETAQRVLEAVRDNFGVYLTLLEAADIDEEQLDEPAARYSLDELLAIAARAREATALASAEELEVEREQRIQDGASRRRDVLFKEYLGAAEGDERWLTALRLVRARAAQELSERRLELLTRRFEAASRYAEETTARVRLAQERLATTADQAEVDALIAAADDAQAAVDEAAERQRQAQIEASGLRLETREGRSEQRLQQLRLLGAEIRLASARIALARAEAERWWTELQLERDTDLGRIGDKTIEWSELARELRGELPTWKRQTEEELLAVQSIDRDGLDRSARRLLDQRLGTAQDTLTRLGNLDAGVADLGILRTVVDNALASQSGALQSWLSNTARGLRTTWLRVTDATGTTLFSVGQTPVTGRDVVQALLILLVALLLSRAVRYGFQRVSRRESVGRQASLYTVSRLTHYTIIILAFFIALTSMGLDLSNLALVAGALSVGIGFGLQSIVNNFVSGLIILFERTLRVGDYIELDTGLTGTVKAINVRSTLINTNDNIDIVVPNSEFVTNRLTNWTLGERILRVRIPFGVAYGSDKELVKKAALEACEEVPYTLTHMPGREPDIWLVDYGDSSLDFLLLVWVNRQGARRPTRTRAAYLWALETKLNEYGIEIPFPQRDLHLRSGWTAPADPGPPTPADD